MTAALGDRVRITKWGINAGRTGRVVVDPRGDDLGQHFRTVRLDPAPGESFREVLEELEHLEPLDDPAVPKGWLKVMEEVRDSMPTETSERRVTAAEKRAAAKAARDAEKEARRRVAAAEREARKACGGSRALVCLTQSLAAGEDLDVRAAGKTWGVFRPGDQRPLLRRATEDRARVAVDLARELLELVAVRGDCPPCGPVLSGSADERRRTKVITPQRPAGEPARYELLEAAEVVPSHDPHGFLPDPRYPD